MTGFILAFHFLKYLETTTSLSSNIPNISWDIILLFICFSINKYNLSALDGVNELLNSPIIE